MGMSPAATRILKAAAPTLLAALALPPPFNFIAAAIVSGALSRDKPAAEPKGGGHPTEPAEPRAEPGVSLPDGDSPSGQDAGAEPVKKPLPAAPDKVVPPLSPDEVVATVESNAEDSNFLLKLRAAEADLKRFEIAADIRFAELDNQDRTRAGDFQRNTGMAIRVFSDGMRLVTFSVGAALLLITAALVAAFLVPISSEKAGVVAAGFGLVGTVVGFLNGLSANIVSFYWGSSQGSKDKGNQIAQTVQDLGNQLGKAAAHSASTPPPTTPPAQPHAINDGAVG